MEYEDASQGIYRYMKVEMGVRDMKTTYWHVELSQPSNHLPIKGYLKVDDICMQFGTQMKQ